MTADSAGNDITTVAVPVTGNLAIAPLGTELPTSEQGADPDLTLAAAFKKVGLLKKDGGPQLAMASSGDPLDFWQEGYSIPSGLADVTFTTTLAQTDHFVRSIIYGKEADENGMILVDGGGHTTEYVLYVEEIFKSGAIRRRIAPKVGVKSVTEDKNARGEILGYQIVFEVKRTPVYDLQHFAEWLILPSA